MMKWWNITQIDDFRISLDFLGIKYLTKIRKGQKNWKAKTKAASQTFKKSTDLENLDFYSLIQV